METINIILFILIAVAFFLVVKRIFVQSSEYKSTPVKKHEIFESYKEQMESIIQRYENEPEELKKQKVAFLRHVSHELHNNIFFEADEAKALVEELAKM